MDGINWHWEDEDRNIMVVTYQGRWTWSDHHRTIDEILAQPQREFTYVVIDMTNTSIPKGSNAHAHDRKVGDRVLLIIVTSNTFLRIIVQTGISISRQGKLYRVVDSLDAAYALIETHRESAKGDD